MDLDFYFLALLKGILWRACVGKTFYCFCYTLVCGQVVVIESCSTDDDGSCVSYLDSEKRSPLHAAAFMVLTILPPPLLPIFFYFYAKDVQMWIFS